MRELKWKGHATMKSSIIKRSVIVNGHKTSISLEDAFWSEVKAIASEKNSTISELLTNIDRDRQASNLSSTLRVFILKHHRDQAMGKPPDRLGASRDAGLLAV